MVGKYLNGYGVVRPARRSRRAGRSGSRSPAGPSRSATASSSTRTARSGTTARKPANYIDYVLGLQGQRAAQGVGAQPQALLPLLQPEQPARREGHSGLVDARSRARTAIPGSIRRHHRPHASRTSMRPTSRTSRKQIRDIPRSRRPAARRHRPALSRPAGEPALRRRRGQEDRQRWSASTATSARPSSSSPRTTASRWARTGSSSRTTSTRRASGCR